MGGGPAGPARRELPRPRGKQSLPVPEQLRQSKAGFGICYVGRDLQPGRTGLLNEAERR